MSPKFIMLSNSAEWPQRKTLGSSGFDIHSLEDTVVPAGCTVVVATGVGLEMPRGLEAQVRSRSGLAAKHSVFVLNSPGTIDSDYKGELKVILHNLSTDDFVVAQGMRIAQIVFSAVYVGGATPEGSQEEQAIRGAGGLGSTGE
jgi:dUTP pyrophosphatase